MFDITDLAAPVWGDKDTGTKFLIEALQRWTEALTSYSGKSDKPTAKVEKVIESLREDEDLVDLVDSTMNEIRSLILSCVQENVEATYLLFAELDEVKKAVGSWRQDANVVVEGDNENDEEERDLVSEFESLDKGRTMIEGTFNAFGLNVMDLPEKFRAQKSERINGKNVKVNEWYLKFPGKLVSPLNESETASPGKTATSMMYTWTLIDSLGDNTIGKASFPYLARFCSTEHTILSTSDLLTSIKAKHGDNITNIETIEVRTPRGNLTGVKVKK